MSAFKYGQLFAEQRRKERSLQIPDLMIAAVSFTLGDCKIATTDLDFLSINGLDVEIW